MSAWHCHQVDTICMALQAVGTCVGHRVRCACGVPTVCHLVCAPSSVQLHRAGWWTERPWYMDLIPVHDGVFVDVDGDDPPWTITPTTRAINGAKVPCSVVVLVVPDRLSGVAVVKPVGASVSHLCPPLILTTTVAACSASHQRHGRRSGQRCPYPPSS